ncbi:hypothetical protein [Bradyrhizobium cenepequi]|uniref:hypothetical protein n=1 Tax=Bradyrhizobium cenepequi TaxID=2821403 RepID=UPI001CE35451|nr:hypothetical protein [Bradyrhizobium cenepequi]MCA6113084.1 hypothetical protein [Bradyrhizobium cenepequi]
MTNSVQLHLRPFVENDRIITNVGYRDALTGRVAASVEISSELIERAVLANVSVEIAFSTDGEIISAASSDTSTSPAKKVHVDDLVKAFLASENLHMEEATVVDLRRLLERLEESVRAVQRSIVLIEQASN